MGSKSETIAASDLIGTWQLQRFDLQEDDEPIHPWGFDTHGILIYAPTKHMSVAINRFAPWAAEGRPAKAAESESQNLFYAGTYCVEEGVVKHFVTQASDPGRIGTVLIRSACLEGEFLTLISRGPGFLANLVWKRVRG